MDAIIIGGSLSGLTLALACARRGISTCVLEQAHGPRRRGGTLGVDRELLMKVIGKSAHHDVANRPFPVLAGRRMAVAWHNLYDWLRAEAKRHPAVTLEDGVLVTKIDQAKDDVIAVAADARQFRSYLIVGADGYRSVVRQAINPEEDEAVYAGHLLWRGLVDEAKLSPAHLPRDHEEVVLVNKAGHRLVAYAVASASGTLAMGERLLSFTWYDGGRSDLLRTLGCVSSSGCVLRTLAGENIPPEVSRNLCELAFRIWPDPWRSIIIHALERRQVFATPVAEYLPRHLVCSRLAMIGDAAHVVSPAMGKGFLSGISDAAALVECLVRYADNSGQAIPSALAAYESRRLPEAHSLVSASQAWSQAFAGRWTSATQQLRPYAHSRGTKN